MCRTSRPYTGGYGVTVWAGDDLHTRRSLVYENTRLLLVCRSRGVGPTTLPTAAGSGADPTAGPVAPMPPAQKVDQKVTALKDLSLYDNWLKDVEKFRTVYGGKLDAEDLAYRIEKACQIKDVPDQGRARSRTCQIKDVSAVATSHTTHRTHRTHLTHMIGLALV